jgi:hypothetical protein
MPAQACDYVHMYKLRSTRRARYSTFTSYVRVVCVSALFRYVCVSHCLQLASTPYVVLTYSSNLHVVSYLSCCCISLCLQWPLDRNSANT